MDAPVQTAAPAEPTAHTAALAAALIEARQTILPKRLVAPGPDAAQLRQILAAAAHAPDHDRLLPWRFIVVPQAAREALADVFERSLRERDPLATQPQLAQAREKAFRAPLLMLAVARLEKDADVPDTERIVSAGCAIQNMLLMATALGFGSALTSGKALRSRGLRTLFALTDAEEPLCFLSIGTPTARKPARERPTPDNYVTQLESGGL
jgi:nitroreductase